MVHHEGLPKAIVRSPDEIMKQRAVDQAKLVAFQEGKKKAAERGEAFDVEKFHDEQDAKSDSIERMNPAPESPESSEGTVENVVETPSRPEHDEEYARLMREAALKRREQLIQNQAKIAEERARLQQLPFLKNPVLQFPRTERKPEPMPKVGSQDVIEIPGFGKAMILSVDSDTRTMYFATPEERRRVDAAQGRDESLSSMQAANFENVIPMTPDQVRQILAQRGQEEDAPRVPINSRYAA